MWFSHLPVLSIHQTHFIKSNVNSEKQVLECTRKIMKINDKFSHIYVACRGWRRLVMNFQGVVHQWKCHTGNDQQDVFGDEKATAIIKVSQPIRSSRMGAGLKTNLQYLRYQQTLQEVQLHVILQCVIKTVKGTSYTLSTNNLLLCPDLHDLQTTGINWCTSV
jgi:hypothetical protein